MSLAYPNWYRGGRWEIERLLRDLFTFDDNPAAVGVTDLRVERMFTDIDDQNEWLEAGKGFLLVHRRGGHLNPLTRMDESIADLAALTKSADESNKLMEYIASVLEAFGEDGGTVYRSTAHLSGLSTTFMVVPGEVVGPQLIPELFRDERYVPATWNIHAERPKGLPDYRESLGLEND